MRSSIARPSVAGGEGRRHAQSARPDLHRPGVGEGAGRLALHVAGRQTGRGEIAQHARAVLLHPVGEIERLLGCQIGEERPVGAAHVLRKALAAAQVVHHDLQKVRIRGVVGVVLFGAIERRERVVVPDTSYGP